MDKPTRNQIQKATQDARTLLETEFSQQLEGIFDIHPDGTIAPEPGAHLDADQRIVRQKIVAAIAHEKAGGMSDRDAVAAYLREASFTCLNRFVALKMLEARDLTQQCISKGELSSGFQEFCGLAPGLAELPDGGYRLYIESLFDELSTEIRVLFDRQSPASLLWPRKPALKGLLSILNRQELEEIWGEDETIGWTYQYFNSADERKKMRDESAAPRNSHELAVRNQFFTPRYVVEFLTDNSLGRIWYEMTQGQTVLKDICRFLVRRPDEVFLNITDDTVFDWLQNRPAAREPELIDIAHAVNGYLRAGGLHEGAEAWFNQHVAKIRAGEAPSFATQTLLDFLFVLHRADRFFEGLLDTHENEAAAVFGILKKRLELAKAENQSQEELLKNPVFIPLREKKDPRDIKILDPACGSGHFLLYAFDLLEIIYSEAWEREPFVEESRLEPEGGLKSLRDTYKSKESLLREVPKLILEHNLHGIDIDPRAVQIAVLSLWLRAQKSWKNIDVKAAVRPLIDKSNIVTAEPMPGEEDMRREFTAALKPRVLGQIADGVFEKMKLAGEAGSLLKVEDEIKDDIAAAARQWHQSPKHEQQTLFPAMRRPRPKQQELRFDVKGISDVNFWEHAEDRILCSLEDYAEQAENGRAVRRRLFVADAARGFAFIDLCRKRYDVVLMNPPFGDASLPSKPYIEDTYGDTKGDVYKAFVECLHARLVPSGYLGIISSRTGFFLGQSEDWRTRVVLRLFRPIVLADLGSGVLDAMVEVAAYVLCNLSEKENRDLTLSLVPFIEKVDRDLQDRFSIPKWQAVREGIKRHQAIAELKHLDDAGFIRRVPGNIIRYMPIWEMVKTVIAPSGPIFPLMICFRALVRNEKCGTLASDLFNINDTEKYVCDPAKFASIPSSPFAYWIDKPLLEAFSKFSPLGDSHLVVSGTGTLDDFRFLRLWFEVSPSLLSQGWFPFAKGGSFSRYYFDQHLLVNWSKDGAEMKAWIVVKYGGGHWARNIRSTEHYFRHGITWPRRSQRGLSIRALPAGCIFGDKGPAIFDVKDRPQKLLALLALTNSAVCRHLISLQIAFGSYEVGVIQRTPIPGLNYEHYQCLATLGRHAWKVGYSLDTFSLVSHAFILPASVTNTRCTLKEQANNWNDRMSISAENLSAIQNEIDNLALSLYGIVATPRILSTTYNESATEENESEEDEPVSADTGALVADLVDYVLGATLGRWDIRLAMNSSLHPNAPDPFAPLLVCSPGMLVGQDGLPAEPGCIVSEEWLRARLCAGGIPSEDAVNNPTVSDDAYPLSVSWDGILVDDPGFEREQIHKEDIVLRAREVLALLWKENAHDIEQEACEILNTFELRDYFRKSFFADHIKRHSKSRRKAPIYWQLSTPSASYSIWLYYHRFTKDTFYRVLNEYVVPKLQFEERELNKIRQQYGINPTAGQRKELASREAFVADLASFKEEVTRIAPLWNPNLNDGVIINFAPLWRLVPQNKAWRKECKQVWDKLVDGEYDWAHLAMHLWPERVVPKCAQDRSLAIAHGLDEVFWQEDDKGKLKPKPVSGEMVKALVQERTSPTVKAALEDLLKAPAPATMAKKKRKKKA